MVDEHFDAVVIGSGFGGSVSAYRLAEAGWRVCVLERGKRWPPGSFARTPGEMAENFWDPSEGGHGLFNFWSFRRIEALVASGLGGGSLVYLNVLAPMEESWFRDDLADGSYRPWPVTLTELAPHYDEVQRMLGAATYPEGHAPYRNTPKTVALTRAADNLGMDARVYPANLAITFANQGDPPMVGVPIHGLGGNLHGAAAWLRKTCELNAECALGCNAGSKNTLDLNYLSIAEQHHGAVLRDHCEVRSFEPRFLGDRQGFAVHYVIHDPEREGKPTDTHALKPHTVTADRLILAAGTLGSTYLMLRNHSAFPGLNVARLGSRFSCNGAMFGMVTGCRTEDGTRPERLEPSIGPMTTTAIYLPDRWDGGDGPACCIEDGGFPNFFGWALEGLDTPGLARRAAGFLWRRVLAMVTGDPRSDYGAALAALFGQGAHSSAAMLLLGMGRDAGDGVMGLNRKRYLKIRASRRASAACRHRIRGGMKAIAGELRGNFAEYPPRFVGRTVTVHPLGGCPMGDERTGVVDSYGQVHGWPDLFVVDGSILPGPVGVNPALTIAALADRAAERFTARPARAHRRRSAGAGGDRPPADH